MEEKKEQEQYYDLLLINLIKTLELSAYISLGVREDPIKKTKKVDIEQAKYNIDMLTMLKEKTKGNVPQEIEKYLKDLLLNLQMEFIKHSNK